MLQDRNRPATRQMYDRAGVPCAKLTPFPGRSVNCTVTMGNLGAGYFSGAGGGRAQNGTLARLDDMRRRVWHPLQASKFGRPQPCLAKVPGSSGSATGLAGKPAPGALSYPLPPMLRQSQSRRQPRQKSAQRTRARFVNFVQTPRAPCSYAKTTDNLRGNHANPTEQNRSLQPTPLPPKPSPA